MHRFRIRPAAREDLAAVAAIYNQGIAERQATFETEPRESFQLEPWLADHRPFLVAVDEQDGIVIGWAQVGPYSDRCCYSGVGEHGIYVASDARGRGVGRQLLNELCATAERQGLHKLTSRVFTDNQASRAVHRAAGFEEIGVQRRHGRLDGQWKDCVVVERLLGDAAAAA